MKKINLALIFVVTCLHVYSQDKVVSWDFPINPNSIEWKELKSYDEQLKAYNIPEDIINKISTKELVKICLAYPEWGVIDAYNDRRIGLNNMMSEFNGFKGLFERNDAARELIKIYAQIDPLAIKKEWTLLQIGYYSFYINCIELILSHEIILDKMEAQDIQFLLDIVILKYNNKKHFPTFIHYGTYRLQRDYV